MRGGYSKHSDHPHADESDVLINNASASKARRHQHEPETVQTMVVVVVDPPVELALPTLELK
ncbi:hypothetical protein GCM10007857_77390 [Bradyrhizobium iriomotense]|uniref:Uncharacterized protein n=1 Tax=Bradyrhizobium iriomotense TaxID=441950 RepID=A0ABQ6BB77_9BRAD|nr:hypothetical protein GCM10007857_77390 [Bradyrhizobium iriomotense]